MPLPEQGRPASEVLAALDDVGADDHDASGGRVFSLVFHAGSDVDEVARAAHERYLWHNALNPGVFPALRRMSADVVDHARWLLTGGAVDEGAVLRDGRPGRDGERVAGFLTSGGTESILMAVLTAKHAGLDRGITRGNIVLPTSAHAAFTKACHYFGLEERRVPVRADWRADPDAIANAGDDDTVLLVASAPQYPQGVIDPVADIAAIAADHGVNCHVDACMGGFTLPFMERSGLLGPSPEPWDFRVPGVTTISADVHKYGYVPKGISVILHRDEASRARQVFVTDGWLGGLYGSSGILGTKPGGPIAAGWAVMQYLGVEGFVEKVGLSVTAHRRFVEGVQAIDGLRVLGDPDATLLAIAADPDAAVPVDPFAVEAQLRPRGWHLDRQGPPDSIHATVTPIQGMDDCRIIEELLADLREVAAEVAAAGSEAADRSAVYGATE
jgi:glutamate/tyrosine decarboxylase-like PLP-dependent enzyme